MTWNFACWQCIDDITGTRNDGGQYMEVGPGTGSTTQPFTTNLTAIFSFLIRSGWTSQDGGQQNIISLGYNGASKTAFALSLINSATNPAMRVAFGDATGNVQRYTIDLGDEDGTNWLSADKWYQVGISADASGISYAVNGSNTPKVTVTTNTPGALNLDANSERWWFSSPYASWGATTPAAVGVQWPSLVLGTSAYSTSMLDFSSSTVRNLIWDSNGDFINPGEDGSGWFGAYGTDQPEYFFTDGSPRHQRGTDTQVWTHRDGTGKPDAPGGLRKQYE